MVQLSTNKLIDWLNRKRICRCEVCDTELHVYAYASKRSVILFCIECTQYYYMEDLYSPIIKYEVPEGLMKLWEAVFYAIKNQLSVHTCN
ncbi:hypothetical protein PALU110988_30070 [Paenibacillus lupini]|nr:hypothetical protein [Paenibacillus lupini]